MRFVLGLAFQNFAMSGKLEFLLAPSWVLAFLGAFILYLSYKYGKKYGFGKWDSK